MLSDYLAPQHFQHHFHEIGLLLCVLRTLLSSDNKVVLTRGLSLINWLQRGLVGLRIIIVTTRHLAAAPGAENNNNLRGNWV